MEDQLPRIIEASIELELLVSDLYLLFYNMFPEDAPFWWRLVEEERNHAALIRSGRDYFEPVHNFPGKMVLDSMATLQESNTMLQHLIDSYSASPPNRAGALNCALKIETSAGELHFQKFIEGTDASAVDKIFQQLNGNDREHAARIRSYMEKNDIGVQSN